MRSILLHPVLPDQAPYREPELALAEAESLVNALDLNPVRSVALPVPRIDPGRYFGPGKAEEIARDVKADEIDIVIVNTQLSPIQQRNLERQWKAKVLDRTGLILEIFGDRARTREGVLQVDLAHLTYQKSRLVRSWTHLERQRGGRGFMGGPGETQIEADRRAIDAAIIRLKRKLEKVVRTRGLHRAARKRVPYPIVALVGYTNAGKSTIFNRLTGAGVVAKDMVFATLDPTMRAVKLPTGRDVILSDTVGFISDLPTQLVAAFRATLEEVLDADLILHVRDISHAETELQAENVADILADLGVDKTPGDGLIEVWNKVDLLGETARTTAETRAARAEAVHMISAVDGAGMDALLEAVETALGAGTERAEVSLDAADGAARAWLYDHHLVRGERMDEDGPRLDVEWRVDQRDRFLSRFPNAAFAPTPHGADG